MSHLKKVYGLTFADMGEVINVPTSRISNYKQGKTRMPADELKRLIDHFEKPNSLSVMEESDSEHSKKIPFYKSDAFATISPAMQGAIPLTPETYMYIPFINDSELSVMITGHSMKGFANHGDHVALKRIVDKNRILMGECYYIITKANNLKTVKFLKRHEDPDYFWLVPYNIEQFEAEPIEKADILELYKVNAILRPV